MTPRVETPLDESPHVLVVDDEPANRQLLGEILSEDGYRISEARNGAEALAVAARDGADVILLDVIMPGVDGVTVCQRLKAAPETAPIPVILVTAQSGREEKIEGIAAGANDFLSKPLDLAELRLKVRNAVQSKRLHDRAESEYRRVLELEASRDSLIHMVVHDMRSTLTAVLGELDLLDLDIGDSLEDEAREGLRSARQGAASLTEMTNMMLDLSRLESGEMPIRRVSADVGAVLEAAVGSLGPDRKRVQVQSDPGPGEAQLECDAELLQRVFSNLIGNALDYSPCEEIVVVRLTRVGGGWRITVTDRGPGIPPEDRARIFEKFGQVEGREKGTKASAGIGLAFCTLAVQTHDGTIGVESGPEVGSTFWVELPA